MLLFVTCLGAILTTVGMFAAAGLDQVGTAYNVLSTASMCLYVLSIVVMGVFWQDLDEDEQNQSQEEHDSSLL